MCTGLFKVLFWEAILQIASVVTGLNQLNQMHLRTHLVCSELFIYPLKKFVTYFSKIFKDLCPVKWGKLPRKI